MIFRKTTFFLLLFAILVLPFFAWKIIWLAGAAKTNGVIQFRSKGITTSLDGSYLVVSFVANKDTVWFHGRDRGSFTEGEITPVIYQRNNPEDARLNDFASVWGDTLIYSGIPFVILLMLFLQPAIVPWRSRIRIVRHSPYLLLES